jgi:hypothetical protein
MVGCVFALRNSLTRFAYAKCTHEMETFSARFHLLKVSGQLTCEPFVFDVDSVSERVRPLAEAIILLGTPVIVQTLVPFETVVALATEFAQRKIQFASDEQFLAVARAVGIDEDEREKLEICLRIVKCAECFDVQRFLQCFSRNREEMGLLRSVGSAQRIALTVSLAASQQTESKEEEEDAGDKRQNEPRAGD